MLFNIITKKEEKMNKKMLVKGMVLTLCLALIPFLAGSAHAQKPIELAFALHTAWAAGPRGAVQGDGGEPEQEPLKVNSSRRTAGARGTTWNS
jgi:hypothetical protein